MTDKTTKALNAYVKILKREKELADEYKSTLDEIYEDKEKIEKFLIGVGEIGEAPDIIKEQAPYLAWLISPKTDESVIAAHMQIDRVLIPQSKKKMDEAVKTLKDQDEQLKAWALEQLLSRKSSNFSVKGVGRAEKRVDTKYNVNDKKLVVGWSVEEGVEDELSISFRPNSKFLAKVVEDTDELPPGISSFRENKVVFVKA